MSKSIFINQGAFPKALEYYLKALQIDEKRGFKKGIATHLANIGNIYEDKHDAQKALEYYTKALNIAFEINQDKGQRTKIILSECFKDEQSYNEHLISDHFQSFINLDLVDFENVYFTSNIE